MVVGGGGGTFHEVPLMMERFWGIDDTVLLVKR